MLRNIPEERSSLLRGGSVKSRIKFSRLQRMGRVKKLYTRGLFWWRVMKWNEEGKSMFDDADDEGRGGGTMLAAWCWVEVVGIVVVVVMTAMMVMAAAAAAVVVVWWWWWSSSSSSSWLWWW